MLTIRQGYFIYNTMKIRSTIPLFYLGVTLLLGFLGTGVRAGDMTYVGLPETTSPGGFCMDGSMAGYYIRTGSDPSSLFVIHLRGGGGCSTETDCLARNGTAKGSSLLWEDSITGDRLLDGDCATNPDFCDATAVHVPYCTQDSHLGTNTEISDDTWGLYFDGHSNFAAIVEHLITTSGLGDATDVLLTGGSAGSIGAYFNVDWLADRLGSEVNVKGVPNAGWFNPGSLPGDLEEIFAPSDYDRFTAGDKGNLKYDLIQELDGAIIPDRTKVKNLLSSDCLADYAPNEWWACTSLHIAYRYIKTPLFNIHSQYDTNQIYFTQGSVPKKPDPSEVDSVERYIDMWGKATRASMQQILDNDTKTPKDSPGDGIFSTSCLSHGTFSTSIDGLTWLPIVRDWFFELGEMTESYRLMESCSVQEGELELPCNEATHCRFIHADATWTETYIPYNTDADPTSFGDFGPYYLNDPLRQHLHLLKAPSNENQELTPVYFFSHYQSAKVTTIGSDELDILVGAGYSVISWESVSAITSEEHMLVAWSDFELLWEWFQTNAEKYGLDPNSVIIGGRSRGSIASWMLAHSQKSAIRGIYMHNALPEGVWGLGDALWVDPVTSGSPPAYLTYGPECPKPIFQNCTPSPDPDDIHIPKYGQKIVDRYSDLGMAAMITLKDGLKNAGEGVFDMFPSFAESLLFSKHPATSPVPSEFRNSKSPTTAENLMKFVRLPVSTSPGGRCMDGSQAGYHIRDGTDPDLFVIDFKGGGSCTDPATCLHRNGTKLGSSHFEKEQIRGFNLMSDSCLLNPDFCEATALHIPYCTSDTHRGTAEATDGPEWYDQYYFDGHLNFRAIVEKLIEERGLTNSADTKVLLAGGSAGGVGAIFNGDWLQKRLPLASVKAAPRSGWMTPGALPGDLPALFRPSNYANFSAGTHGNDEYLMRQNGFPPVDLWKVRDEMPARCLDHFVNDTHDLWWACWSVHNAYKYIETPLFNIHNQFDTNIIYSQGEMPKDAVAPAEWHTNKRYVEMLGKAHRRSFQQILDDAPVVAKPHPDGVFAASCATHGTDLKIEIDGTNWLEIVGDWFFQRGRLTEHYRQVEDCGTDPDGLALPCNADEDRCRISFPSPLVEACKEAIDDTGCLNEKNEQKCLQCAQKNSKQLKDGGCTSTPMSIVQTVVKDICKLNYKVTVAPSLSSSKPSSTPTANTADDCVFPLVNSVYCPLHDVSDLVFATKTEAKTFESLVDPSGGSTLASLTNGKNYLYNGAGNIYNNFKTYPSYTATKSETLMCYEEYYGPGYEPNTVVKAALDRNKIDFLDGPALSQDFSETVRTDQYCINEESAKKINQYTTALLEMYQLMESAVQKVAQDNCISYVNKGSGAVACQKAVDIWDNAAAVQDGPNYLGTKRCQNYLTCGWNYTNSVGEIVNIAIANQKVLNLFQVGQSAIRTGDVVGVKGIIKLIQSAQLVSYIQGVSRYAYKISASDTPNVEGENKEYAEGGAFATGMLPQLYKCNRAAAKTVDKTFQLAAGNSFAGTIEDFLAVLRSEYQCLGITCEDVGGLWDGESYYAGAGPCVTNYGDYLAV